MKKILYSIKKYMYLSNEIYIEKNKIIRRIILL